MNVYRCFDGTKIRKIFDVAKFKCKSLSVKRLRVCVFGCFGVSKCVFVLCRMCLGVFTLLDKCNLVNKRGQ